MEMQRLSKEIFSFWFQASTSLKKAKKSIPSREILQQYYFFYSNPTKIHANLRQISQQNWKMVLI